jgi:PKD repeat protein
VAPGSAALTHMTQSTLKAFAILSAAALISGCTMKDSDPPAFAGPSEFGQSVSVSVNPDSLPQDGASQSLVTVTVRDKDSAPMRNVTLRVETRVNGSPVDFGSLSARSIVTGSDGRATFIYTAPAAPAVTVDNFTVVDIGATPVGTDFNSAVLRTAAIRLTPPGIIVPPSDLRAAFTVTPGAPLDHQTALFDAGGSQGTIADYQWNFGDGDRASGRTAQHAYDAPGTYVATLTIVDPYGRIASTSQSINVGAGISPTAAFVFSPTNPRVGTAISFNASSSRAAAGGRIVSYTWDFGDGSPRVTTADTVVSKTYAQAATYTITLLVTDQAGRTGTISLTIQIAP